MSVEKIIEINGLQMVVGAEEGDAKEVLARELGIPDEKAAKLTTAEILEQAEQKKVVIRASGLMIPDPDITKSLLTKRPF